MVIRWNWKRSKIDTHQIPTGSNMSSGSAIATRIYVQDHIVSACLNNRLACVDNVLPSCIQQVPAGKKNFFRQSVVVLMGMYPWVQYSERFPIARNSHLPYWFKHQTIFPFLVSTFNLPEPTRNSGVATQEAAA